jgi:MFS family permease
LAPFQIRAFRFQWPADLATSWAFEMETLILGWYVLVETRSVLMLTVFASLQHLGTLISPLFGVMGDRLGHRNVLCAMRAIYLMLAMTLMSLAFTGLITPTYALVIAAMTGLVRPSDIGMRAALVGNTMPPTHMLGAMSIQRTTQDSAKIVGALSGAALMAILGMSHAYLVVAGLYLTSVLLTLKAGAGRAAPRHMFEEAGVGVRASPWRDLKDGALYVWHTPHLRAAMCLAFLLNLTAFPLFNGLMPYVAKEIYLTDQNGLAQMVAAAASGALLGSIVLTRFGGILRPARAMIIGGVIWYSLLFVFANVPYHTAGLVVLVLAGCSQSVSQVPMAALILRTSDERYRGRVMGIRMLAIYGNLPGLLLAGPLITAMGYPLTAMLYCTIGMAGAAMIAAHWRAHLWKLDAHANTR